MKPATVHQLRKKLADQSHDELVSYCVRLAKYKKENKELLSYLLFETDEDAYVRELKVEVDELFTTVNRHQVYFAKKTIRKILRFIDRFIRYTGNKESELKMRIHFCKRMHELSSLIQKSAQMQNLYIRQMSKIEKALESLHEDLQYDYHQDVSSLARSW